MTSPTLPRGRVTPVGTTDPGSAVDGWTRLLIGSGSATRVVTIALERPTDLSTLVDRWIDALAATSLALWPDWYGADLNGATWAGSPIGFPEMLGDSLVRVGREDSGVLASWAGSAARLCREGRKPRPRGFAAPVQVAQLALTLGPGPLGILIRLDTDDLEAQRRYGLARAAEWLARETDAIVVLIAPDSLVRHPEFDVLGTHPLTWPPFREKSSEPVPEERLDLLQPIRGRPHPYSPGEQRLAEWLARDAELGPLFAFNREVRSRFDHGFRVDLLWDEGKVVVEVDGLRHHANPYAFVRDRQRDYELLVSGYLVLRLPHDEVMEDAGRAVEKIRDVVRLRCAGRA